MCEARAFGLRWRKRPWSARLAGGGRLAGAFVAALLVAASPAAAQEVRPPPARLVLDAGASRVRFVLGATLHHVEGTVPIRRGEIRFHPEGGPARGEVVLDAEAIDTGNARRDRTMHETVLESARYPRIVFVPERLEVVSREEARATVRLHGSLAIHGGRHDVTLEARVRAEGGRLRAEGTLRIPYVAWGMEDPSTFLLRVEEEVAVRFDAVGRVEGIALPGTGAGADVLRGAPARPETEGAGGGAGARSARAGRHAPAAAPLR